MYLCMHVVNLKMLFYNLKKGLNIGIKAFWYTNFNSYFLKSKFIYYFLIFDHTCTNIREIPIRKPWRQQIQFEMI